MYVPVAKPLKSNTKVIDVATMTKNVSKKDDLETNNAFVVFEGQGLLNKQQEEIILEQSNLKKKEKARLLLQRPWMVKL